MKVAAIPGDGIGLEVLPVATEVVDAAMRGSSKSVQWTWFDWGCDYFHEHGRMMPEDGLDVLSEFDAILLGAVGRPDVPDHESLWGLLIPIRRRFDQYVNLRPVRLFGGVAPRVLLPDGETVDMVIVRENVEGEYSEMGGRFAQGTDREIALQENVFSRFGIERITTYAAECARRRRGLVTSATKSNGIIHTMPFWDEVVGDVGRDYPDVGFRSRLIDALAAELVLKPQEFDVIVASNLFGDILSDLAAAVVGGLGVAASANLNPTRERPSMFEPVHGSAPDIAGLGIANPVAATWSGAMMLEHLGCEKESARIMAAIETTLSSPRTRTGDLGGTADTGDVSRALVEALAGAENSP